MPKLAIFKSLFRVEADDCCSDSSYLNEYWNYGSGEAIRPSWANGKIFALSRFEGSTDSYREYLETNFSLAGSSCAFLDMPRTYAAAIMESRRLDFLTGRGIPHLSLEDLQEHSSSANCPTTVLSAIERYLR